LQGKKIYEKKMYGNFSLKLPQLDKGFYLIKINQEITKIIIK